MRSQERAHFVPGRWNHFGTPMVYAASAASLAVLEYVAHVRREVQAPVKLLLLEIQIPSEAMLIAQSELPATGD